MIFAKYRKKKLENIVQKIYNDNNSIYYYCKRNYNNNYPEEEHCLNHNLFRQSKIC